MASWEAEPGRLTQEEIGVRRDYRRRGLATMLKVRAVEFARKHGYETINVWNKEANTAVIVKGGGKVYQRGGAKLYH